MTAITTQEAGRKSVLKGILLVCGAVFVFALADVTTKHLTMRYSVPSVAMLRYMVNLLLLTAILLPKNGKALFRTKRTGLVLFRAGCLAAATLSMGLALRSMPVGETVAIIYLSPFAVMLLAIPMLGEKAGVVGWLGAALGFAGVLLIVRPGGSLDPVGVFYALITASMTVGYHLLSRVLARTETMMAMLFYTALVGFGVFAILVVWNGDWPQMTPIDLLAVFALGIFATLGHFLFTAAYRLAPASILSPVNYLHLVWAAALGWVFFGHVPDGPSLIGMLLVLAAGAAVAVQAHRSRS